METESFNNYETPCTYTYPSISCTGSYIMDKRSRSVTQLGSDRDITNFRFNTMLGQWTAALQVVHICSRGCGVGGYALFWPSVKPARTTEHRYIPLGCNERLTPQTASLAPRIAIAYSVVMLMLKYEVCQSHSCTIMLRRQKQYEH
jgi:hypothetical protein